MKVYVLSLGAGLMVGILYALVNVRSPAPPVVALIGLLGMLAGEQIPPLVRQALRPAASAAATPAPSASSASTPASSPLGTTPVGEP